MHDTVMNRAHLIGTGGTGAHPRPVALVRTSARHTKQQQWLDRQLVFQVTTLRQSDPMYVCTSGRRWEAEESAWQTRWQAAEQLWGSWDVVPQSMYLELHIATLAVKERRRTDEEDDFNIRFGRAVRVLREDIPRFFQRPQNLDIFREDVRFIDGIGPRIGLNAVTSCTVTGKEQYARHLWLLRFHASLVFSSKEVDVLRIWQRDSHTLAVRWTLRLCPRLLNKATGAMVYLDGVSNFYFDRKGLIYEHRTDVINWDGLLKGLQRQDVPAYNSMLTPTC